jgi:ABC-2 type transport system ATP-binding protein
MVESGALTMNREVRIELNDINFDYPSRSRISLQTLRPVIRRVSGRQVLEGVSLSVAAGERVVVIGVNGCGKSTLIKVIAGAQPPVSGEVKLRGSVAAMVELGAGFDVELSVHDNILLNAALNGHRVKDVRASIPEILEWADLVDLEWEPVRTLSSGMTARLGFSVATQFQPDILLIDEVLAVGDARFKERSEARMGALVNSGAAVVVVTHDMDFALRQAHTCVWLAHGKVHRMGDPAAVVQEYIETVLHNPQID